MITQLIEISDIPNRNIITINDTLLFEDYTHDFSQALPLGEKTLVCHICGHKVKMNELSSDKTKCKKKNEPISFLPEKEIKILRNYIKNEYKEKTK